MKELADAIAAWCGVVILVTVTVLSVFVVAQFIYDEVKRWKP